MLKKENWTHLLSLIAILGLIFGGMQGTAAAAEQDAFFDLAIDMKAPMYAAPGETYVVHISYTNLGTIASPADTWVRATLPAGVEFVSAKNREGYPMPPDSVDGSMLTWVVGPVAPGACCERILITIAVPDTLPEKTALTTLGEVGSASSETNTVNKVFSITSSVCDLAGSVKQAQVSQAKPVDVITYSITIRLKNRPGKTEAASARSVELIDSLPDTSQVRFLGWVGENAGTYDGAQLRWQGQVKAGEVVMLQYRLGIEGSVPAGTLIRNRARLTWNGGEMDMDPVDVEVLLTGDDKMIGPEGGQWQHQSGLTLDVPRNAVQQQTRFQYRQLFEDTPPPDAPAGWLYAHHAFELTAHQFGELHQFGENLTITIRYRGEDTAGLDPNTLRLWYRDGPGEPWAMLGEPLMHQNGQISFTTDHLTEFALFGQAPYQIYLPLIRK